MCLVEVPPHALGCLDVDSYEHLHWSFLIKPTL